MKTAKRNGELRRKVEVYAIVHSHYPVLHHQFSAPCTLCPLTWNPFLRQEAS